MNDPCTLSIVSQSVRLTQDTCSCGVVIGPRMTIHHCISPQERRDGMPGDYAVYLDGQWLGDRATYAQAWTLAVERANDLWDQGLVDTLWCVLPEPNLPYAAMAYLGVIKSKLAANSLA